MTIRPNAQTKVHRAAAPTHASCRQYLRGVIGLMAALACGNLAPAASPWFTAITRSDETTPVAAQALAQQAWPAVPGATLESTASQRTIAAASVTSGSIDLVMTIPDNPAGDDNGNQQDQPGSAAQDKWERIIQHFADGVYESTNGGHTIRRVRIYRGGKNASNADIVWGESGHPHVPTGGGAGESGGHINMYKVFSGGQVDAAGKATDLNMLDTEKGSGYTMAHEWGHYFYGLYDEYKRDSNPQSVVKVTPSIMNSQWMAVGGEYKWLNFSIARQTGATAGGPYQNTEATDQHDYHKASCWETLKRTVDKDVLKADALPLGKRIYYSEVASRAPAGTNSPALDLPATAARAQLDIIWMKDEIALQIVIDNSGSMLGTPLEQAKLAAKLMVDRAPTGSARVGVIKFNSAVTTVTPLTLVTSDADKTSIKAAIDTITSTGNTAIGDAAAAALPALISTAIGTNVARAVFLLSDGESNTGRAPLSVVPSYTQAQVPLFTFGFGSGADTTTLRSMADQTGGRFYSSTTTTAAIVQVFDDAFGKFLETPKNLEGSATAPAGSSALASFDVDASAGRLQTAFTINRNITTDRVVVRSPSGVEYAANATGNAGIERLLYVDVPNPVAGRWQVVSTTASAGARVSYQVSSVPTGSTYIQTLTTGDGATAVRYPATVVLRTKVDRSRRVAGMTVSARVINPDGTESTVTFADSGTGPDQVAGDGIYSAEYRYRQNGVHQFFVTCDNRDGTARFTNSGATRCPGPASAGSDGQSIPALPDLPINEAFTRSASLQVTTSGGVFTVSAPVITTQPAAQTIAAGNTVTLSVAASGSPAPTFQWNKDGSPIAGATNATYTITAAPASATGRYSVTITNSGGSVTSSVVQLTVNPSNPGRLVNLAIRSNAGTGSQTLIVGLTLGGAGTSGSKPILLRGIGPALGLFGLSGTLADPILSLFSGATIIATNNDWGGDAQVTGISSQVGAFALPSLASRDAALVGSYNGGGYSVQITGVGGASGLALAEIYDATPAASYTLATPRLTNISARTQVGTGGDVLIAGFAIGGASNITLLIRAVGPTLTGFGVGGVLIDPKLELYTGTTLRTSNDNWGGAADIVAAAAQVGAFALAPTTRDAALLVTLPPGTYTAQVSGVGNTTGVALVEIYEVP